MSRAIDVANFMIERSLENKMRPLDLFRLNKALYVAQGISLSKRNKPLFNDDIEAWEHGPVIRDVYFKFNQYKGRRIINEPSPYGSSSNLTCEDVQSIFDAISFYDLLESSEIYDFAHDEHSPWKKYYDPNKRSTSIPKKSIKDYFDFDLISETRSERIFQQIPEAKRVRSFDAPRVLGES